MGNQLATTQWSVVLAAKEGTESEARQALGALCVSYWYPAYAFIRVRGFPPEEARDLTQSFFADLLERDVMSAVDRSKGRFRSFLYACLGNFLSHQRDQARTIKRGGQVDIVTLEAPFDAEQAERRYRREPVDEMTPEQVYERRWGLTVMERSMQRLEAEYEEAGKGEQFQGLRRYLTGSEPHISYKAIAEELGMSEGAVKNAVMRMRQRYGAILREEVGDTVAADELDDELRHLLTVIKPYSEGDS